MADDSTGYLSYLLRLWREETNHMTAWRASLESVQTGERHNFATLDELIVFLRQCTAQSVKCGGKSD